MRAEVNDLCYSRTGANSVNQLYCFRTNVNADLRCRRESAKSVNYLRCSHAIGNAVADLFCFSAGPDSLKY